MPQAIVFVILQGITPRGVTMTFITLNILENHDVSCKACLNMNYFLAIVFSMELYTHVEKMNKYRTTKVNVCLVR